MLIPIVVIAAVAVGGFLLSRRGRGPSVPPDMAAGISRVTDRIAELNLLPMKDADEIDATYQSLAMDEGGPHYDPPRAQKRSSRRVSIRTKKRGPRSSSSIAIRPRATSAIRARLQKTQTAARLRIQRMRKLARIRREKKPNTSRTTDYILEHRRLQKLKKKHGPGFSAAILRIQKRQELARRGRTRSIAPGGPRSAIGRKRKLPRIHLGRNRSGRVRVLGRRGRTRSIAPGGPRSAIRLPVRIVPRKLSAIGRRRGTTSIAPGGPRGAIRRLGSGRKLPRIKRRTKVISTRGRHGKGRSGLRRAIQRSGRTISLGLPSGPGGPRSAIGRRGRTMGAIRARRQMAINARRPPAPGGPRRYN